MVVSERRLSAIGTPRAVLVCSVLWVLAMLASSCSGSSQEAGSGDAGGEVLSLTGVAAGGDRAAALDAIDTAGAGDGEISPLAEYLGPGVLVFERGGVVVRLGGAIEEFSEEQIQELHEYERLVAACMADLGFDYVPFVATNLPQPPALSDAYALPPAEFAEKYGYGFSTLHIEIVTDDRLRFDETELVEELDKLLPGPP